MRGAVILFAATAALAEPGGWKTYSYPDAGFSAAFPAKPREAIQAHRSATLGRLESRVYLVEHGGAAYVVTAITLPAKARAETTASALLDDARDGFVAGVRGTLRRESELTLEGHPGRAIEASAAGQIVFARLFLVRERLFQLAVVFPRETDGGADAKRFLDGFALTGRRAPRYR